MIDHFDVRAYFCSEIPQIKVYLIKKFPIEVLSIYRPF